MINIVDVRKETKNCEQVIHFNNAGAALMPRRVVNTIRQYLDDEENNGGYETQAKWLPFLNQFYDSAAKLVNANAHEIAFTESASRAWTQAFYSFNFKPGDKILTTLSEYGSNVIAYLQQAKRQGVEVVFIPNDEVGQIDIQALENQIDDRVRLISMNHIPTGGGLVNPAAQVGQIARRANIPYLLDACQSVGHMDIDVEQIGCDILTATGRKYLRGPRGTGFLYMSQRMLDRLEPPMLDQFSASLISTERYEIRSDARRYEMWEANYALKAGLKVAIDYALELGLDNIKSRIYKLAHDLRDKLNALDFIKIMDQGSEQCGIVTFTYAGVDASDVKAFLSRQHINVTVSQGSGSLVIFENRGIKKLIRASLHYYNTVEEIDRFIELLKKMK